MTPAALAVGVILFAVKPVMTYKAVFRNGQDRSLQIRQYRIILSADTASEVRQLLSQKRR